MCTHVRLPAKKHRLGNANFHSQHDKAHSSDRCETGARVAGRLYARSRAEIFVFEHKLFFCTKNAVRPLAPRVGGVDRRGEGRVRRASEARPRFSCKRRLPLVYATGGVFRFLLQRQSATPEDTEDARARTRGGAPPALTP